MLAILGDAHSESVHGGWKADKRDPHIHPSLPKIRRGFGSEIVPLKGGKLTLPRARIMK